MGWLVSVRKDLLGGQVGGPQDPWVSKCWMLCR